MKNHGSEQTVTIGGKTYRLSKFTLSLYRQFEQWAKPQLADPFKDFAGRISGLSPELQKYAWDQACEDARQRGNPGSPAMQALMQTIDGVIYLIFLLLRKYHPELTVSQVEDLVTAGTEEHGADFFERLFGVAKGEMPVDEADATAAYLEQSGVWGDGVKKKSAETIWTGIA